MDLNIRKKNWKNNEIMLKIIKKFIFLADLVFLSEEDLNNINCYSIKKFTNFFCKNPTDIVFRKKQGIILYYVKNELLHKIKIKMRKKVTDTTGCGDSFNASFIRGYLKNDNFFTIVNNAHKLASSVAMNRGAIIKRF